MTLITQIDSNVIHPYTVNTNKEPVDSYQFLSSKSYMPIIPNMSIVIIISIVKETTDNNVHTYKFLISP